MTILIYRENLCPCNFDPWWKKWWTYELGYCKICKGLTLIL